MSKLQRYTVKSIIRGYQPVCYCIRAFCLGVKWLYSHVSTGFFPPAVPSATCFISLLAAVMLETGIANNRGPTYMLEVSKQGNSVDKHMEASYIGHSRNRFQVDFHG